MSPAATMAERPESLDRLLAWSAARFPQRGLAIHDRRGRELERRSFVELERRVRDRALRLARIGVEPGQRVVLCLDTSFELVESWFAALALGAQPIATAPPGALGAGEAQLERLERVLERLDARHLVGTSALGAEALRAGRGALANALIDEERIASAAPLDDARAPRAEPSDLAFLQLTSGSTGFPRGVSITHANALHNVRAMELAIAESLGAPVLEHTDALVSWLPLNHDMGLVGCLLAAIAAGVDVVLLPPRLFLAKPELWLRALAAGGRAVSSAPNFGYQTAVELCTGELEPGGLAGWHTALVGAEMVRPETMHAFADRFERDGFDARALRPCYGLAEATLAVTFDRRGRGVRTRRAPAEEGSGNAREVACVGEPVVETEVAVVAPDGNALPEGAVGSVRVRGPGVFAGYFGEPEASARALRDGWLDTGDLGFLHAGELYLTGRTKEILVLRGHNLMPHELEWCAEAEAGAGGTCRAGAFSIDAGAQGEAAVLVVEVARPEPDALAALDRAIRTRVGRALGLTLADVCFVRRGRIPKTTSGKVRRGELRELYLARQLERIGAEGAGAPARGDA